LEGGLRDDSLWKAMRINAFPTVAVIDSTTFIPDITKKGVENCEELRCAGKVWLQRKPTSSEKLNILWSLLPTL